MKTVLLLGGFGFIGTNLLKYIDKNTQSEFKVLVFDKISSHPHGLKFQCVQKTYAGDFANETVLESIFADNKIDLVIHLLTSTIPLSTSTAQYDVETNLIPTIKLLDIMKKHNVHDIVFMSSGGAIYGDVLQKVHNEEDAVYPKSSYGIVKLAIEKFLLYYSELYNFNTLILRLSNPYGPYHYNDKQGVINIAVRKALSNQIFQIWGDGNGIKDYIYIDDVCSIILKLIKNDIETGVYNIAASEALSVNDIVDAIKEYIPSFETEHLQASTNDVQSFELDITKLRRRLGGGMKRTRFTEGLEKTIKWQKGQ